MSGNISVWRDIAVRLEGIETERDSKFFVGKISHNINLLTYIFI